MKRTNKMSLAIQPLFQDLEQRTMFSVVMAGVQNGTLFVTGSGGKDKLMLSLHPTTAGADVLLVNGTSRTMKMFHDVQHVSVYTGGGDDTVLLSGLGLSESDTSPYISVSLGNGNDRLVLRNFDGEVSAFGGDGNDTIDASMAIGNDAILGLWSNRYIDGGAGNDTILGSAANDTLIGGDDDDLINAGDGDDFLIGGRGTNVLNGQGGDDTFGVYPVEGLYNDGTTWSMGGNDVIDGGDGYDLVDKSMNSKFVGTQTFSTKSIANVEQIVVNDYGTDIGGGKG